MDRIHLELTFDDDSPPRLVKTCFSHPMLHQADHQRLDELQTEWGDFSWSHGPKALGIFLIKARLRWLRRCPGECRFHDAPEQSLGEGIRRIHASSEAWKVKIFGHDSGGAPLLFWLLHHGSSGGRHSVQLVQKSLPAEHIRIVWQPFGDISGNQRRLRELIDRMVMGYFPMALHDCLHAVGDLALPHDEVKALFRRPVLLAPVEDHDVLASRKMRLITITGGSGFGKSTLARQLAERLAADGEPVLWMRWEQGSTIAVLVTQLRKQLRQVERAAADLEAFRTDFPPESAAPAEQARHLGRLLARHGVHLVLDNLDPAEDEWPCVASFVEAFCAEGSCAKLIVTAREAAARLLAAAPSFLTIPVAPLRRDQTEEYFRALYPEAAGKLEEADFRQLHERSRGNFHRIKAIAEKLRNRIGHVPNSQLWDNLPTSEEDCLGELTPGARKLLEHLAAFRGGTAFDYPAVEYLAAQAQLPRAALTEQVVELSSLGMLCAEEKEDDKGDVVYRMPDPIRRMVDDWRARRGARRAERRRTHWWLARYYGMRGDVPAHLIEAYYHWVMSGRVERGVLLLITNEKFLFDLDYATDLERCLAMARPAMPAQPMQKGSMAASERLLRGRMHYYHGRYDQAMEEYTAAVDIIEEGLREAVVSGRAASGRQRGEKGPAEIEARLLNDLLLPALEQRGLVHRKRECFREARADFRRCLKLSREQKKLVWETHPLSNLGMIERERGRCARAARYFELALRKRLRALARLERQQRLPDAPFWCRELAHVQLADLYALLVFCALELDDVPAAQRWLGEAAEQLELAGEHRADNYYRGRFLSASAFTRARQGAWDDALVAAQEAYEFPKRKSNHAGEIAGRHCLGIVHLMRWQQRGDAPADEAAGWLEHARQHLEACHTALSRPQGQRPTSPLKLARLYRALSMVYQGRSESRSPTGKRKTRGAGEALSLSDHYLTLARECARKAGKPLDDINPLSPLV